MLGWILIYFVGRKFYNLAGKYDKHQWGFGILGVVSYYAGLLLGALALGIIFELVSPGSIENVSDVVVGLMAIPIGILTCWGTYILLQRSWSKPSDLDSNTLDSSLIAPEENRYQRDK
jgi:hypothetical protein